LLSIFLKLFETHIEREALHGAKSGGSRVQFLENDMRLAAHSQCFEGEDLDDGAELGKNGI
jgi:hypothetical protein